MFCFTDNAGKTEIIILTGNNEIPNVTVHNMEIFLQLKNETADKKIKSEPKVKRKKRNTNIPAMPPSDENLSITDEQLQKAREVILKHDVLCNNNEKQEICKDFVTKLKAIVANHEESKAVEDPSRIKLKVNDEHVVDDSKTKQNNIAATDFEKREALPNTHLDSILQSVPEFHMEARDIIPYPDVEVAPHPHTVSPQHLSETCLMARLLKQHYPRSKG